MKSSLPVILLLIVGGLAGNFLRFADRKAQQAPQFERIPLELNGYFGEEHRFSEASYRVLQADTSVLRIYHDAQGHRFGLFVGYFSSQKYGSQVHSPKHCLPGGGWQIRSLNAYPLNLGDETFAVNQLIIGLQEKRQLMLYWFRTRGGTIRSEFGLKLDLARNALLLRPTDAAFVRITTDLEPGESQQQAMTRMIGFARSFYRPIETALPFTK